MTCTNGRKNIMDKELKTLEIIENLNKRISELTDIVEAMIMTQQDMYNKIEFLEKRIRLVEFVDNCQDKEIEILSENGGMDK